MGDDQRAQWDKKYKKPRIPQWDPDGEIPKPMGPWWLLFIILLALFWLMVWVDLRQVQDGPVRPPAGVVD